MKGEKKNSCAKWKDEEASFPPSTLQIWSSHQKQTQKTEPKPPGQSASAETQDPLLSMQPTTGNASKLWGLASRNSIIIDIQAKEHHTDDELRSLTPEAVRVAYPSTTWARAYTDGSAEEAPKHGGGGEFIKLPNDRSIRKSVATGQESINYRAQAYTFLAAGQTLRLPTKTMFLTDCRSILQSLKSPGEEQIFSNIRQELSLLKNKTSVTLQRIPSHCGFGGHEEADWMSKKGSKLEQSAHPMSYCKAKTILRNNFRTEWRQRLDTGTEEDSIQQLDRAVQATIFRLRTGHCQLLSHLHRPKISHSDECPCSTGPQTPNHILRSCPTFDALWHRTWPSPVESHRKLWGLVKTLWQTAGLKWDKRQTNKKTNKHNTRKENWHGCT